MVAYKSYNNQIVGGEDVLLFVFECKVCQKQWFGSFCQCPSCKKVTKYRILSSERAIQVLMQNEALHQMSVYGLLLEGMK